MDVVIVWAGFTHGLEAPEGRGGSHQFGVLLMKVTVGCVRRLAAE